MSQGRSSAIGIHPERTDADELKRAYAGSTGLSTWGAAIRLGNHLLCHPQLVQSRRCLEIGSGNGLLACLVGQMQQQAATAPASSSASEIQTGSYLATELPQVLPLLQSNIELSEPFQVDRSALGFPLAEEEAAADDLSEHVHAAELDWSELDDPFVAEFLSSCQAQTLLGSDIVSTSSFRRSAT